LVAANDGDDEEDEDEVRISANENQDPRLSLLQPLIGGEEGGG